MKKIFTFALTSFYFVSFSQFSVAENTNAMQLAQQLAGTGVTISNATLNCPSSTFGAFSGTFTNANPSLGISDGVLLTTGGVLPVNDSGGSAVFISDGAGAPGDPNLNSLLNQLGETYTTNDACVLEFDINVIGDTLKFNYVMGSEEYPTYVCGSVNDIFGFFISGPNPAGGNYVNQNVALIPGTNLPVSINTVNNGGFGSAVTCYNGTYSNFMNPNPSPISSVPNIAYNELTRTLQAKAATVPCAQYHFKLAIADGGDDVFDSGVFLEAGSFSSTGVIVASSTILGEGFNTAVESCIDGLVTFVLEDGINTTSAPIGIPYSFTGSATHLVDFVQLPYADTIWIQPGDSSSSIQIYVVPDAISEGVETIEINVQSECGLITASTMLISDIIPFNVAPFDDSLCLGQTIDFEVTGAQTYSWFPTTGVSNPNSGSTTLSPTTTTTYTVSYTLGSCNDDTTFTIYVSDLTANLFTTNETCPNDNDGTAYFTYQNGVGNVSYIWNDGNTDSLRTNLQANNYCVTLSDQGGCALELCNDITEPDLFLSVFAFQNILCQGDDSIEMQLFSTLSPNATYAWTPASAVTDPSSNFINYTNNINSLTTITVTATDLGCTVSDQLTINVSDLSATINVTDVSCPGDSDGSLEAVATGGFGGPFFFWDNFEFTSSISNLSEGTYCVEVSDFDCVITLCEEVSSNAPSTLNLSADDTILCNETSTNIYINSNISNGTYTWSPAENFVNTGAPNQNFAQNLQGNTLISVTAIDENNCVITDQIVIETKTLTVNADYLDTTISSGSTIDIGVNVVAQENLTENISFTWTPETFLSSANAENTTTTPTENIVYTIYSSADGCTDVDSIAVYVGIELEMPDAFSPNGDGLNDVFQPILKGGNVIAFRIYDRWGKLVHDDATKGWDGKFKNKEQGTEVYHYYMHISNSQNEITKMGTFNLLR